MLADPAFELLAPNLRRNQGNSLWIVDENVTPYLTDFLAQATNWSDAFYVLTNRYDVALQFKTLGLNTYFSDFDFEALPLAHFDNIYYRVSKEKAVVHHILNQTPQRLAPQGTFYLSGAKKEGIQSYLTKLNQWAPWPLSKSRGKQQSTLAALERPSEQDTVNAANSLDDKNYAHSRPILHQNRLTLHSKPGVFCWDRIDPGSLFLSEHLEALLDEKPIRPDTCLDLGCGYGYLAAMAHQHGIKHVVATDNNAAALKACQINFDENAIAGKVIAAHCGDSIKERFDLVLCNPPFHHGFKTDPALTQHFLRNARRLIAPHGQGLFVVNGFIPLEKLAGDYFKRCRTLANNNSFKLIVLE